jgi:hypothetical protein
VFILLATRATGFSAGGAVVFSFQLANRLSFNPRDSASMTTPIRSLFIALAIAASSVLCAETASAPKLEFPSASPPATLKQRVGVTDIEINYSRPSTKGRKIFGGLVPYGQVWRTGANQATRISFSTPVKINGTALAAGNYELFSIPGEQEWTVIFHQPMSQWGAYSYDQKNDVARVAVKTIMTPVSVETFSISLTEIRDESATLYFSWDKTRVPMKLEVDVEATLVPQIEQVMASDAANKPYFPAAMFYLDHDVDLKKAAAWFDAAIAAQPNGFYIIHHKARLLAKQGDKAGAIAAAKKSIEIAETAGGPVKDEYVRLNEALIASLN